MYLLMFVTSVMIYLLIGRLVNKYMRARNIIDVDTNFDDFLNVLGIIFFPIVLVWVIPKIIAGLIIKKF